MSTLTADSSSALVRTRTQRPTSGAVEANTREVLRHIQKSDVYLAVWERSLPVEAAAYCARVPAAIHTLDLDITTAIGSALLAKLSASPFFSDASTDATKGWLLEDIFELASEFASLAGSENVRLRFSKVTDCGCAAFHVDTLSARLLCTYAGKGTEWADEPDVCRDQLGLRGRTVDEANAAIIPDAARIRTMPTGAVAIFKGRRWPGSEQRGLVHRSAPVCCADHARLLLVIDPGLSY